MHASEFIARVHRELQTLASGTTVLLGGSYWLGEPEKESDIDFYILCGWKDFLGYKKFKLGIEEIKIHHSNANINCLFVPLLFFNRGWFYGAGKTISGETKQSPVNRKIIFRSAIKLAYYHVLQATVKPNNNAFKKAKRQLAIAQRMVIRNPVSAFDLQPGYLKIEEYGEASALIQAITAIWQANRAWQSFSLINWLTYNIKFLRRGKALFLFTNPDKLIIRKMKNGLIKNAHLAELSIWAGEYVFPVVML